MRPTSALHPALPWAGPFIVFVALLAVMPRLDLSPRISLSLWVALTGAAILLMSREILEFRPVMPVQSALVGVGVFCLWVAPDLLSPGWRSHWLFQNALTGNLSTSLPAAALSDPLALSLRVLRAVVIVPIVEELFWRGWLMRYLVKPDFLSVRLGTFTAVSFWSVAALFALEHGPYWDVGLLAGAVYNGWLVRSKRVSDLILAHAVTNACLCAFVLATGRWEYWL